MVMPFDDAACNASSHTSAVDIVSEAAMALK